jgi:hypothetical protein
MANPLPAPDLADRFAGRLVIPSQEDAERIERAVDILVESLEVHDADDVLMLGA